MDRHAYPGKGLSLPQLIFALNEELERVAYSQLYVADSVRAERPHSPPFRNSSTLDAVSQLDKDTSVALATIREWRNSLVPINRVPLDVLSLIPTHLSSWGDIFRVSSVCRHWCRTFIQHATLWSRLRLTRSTADLYVKTLLERSKESALDIVVASHPITTDCVRAEALELLSPHTQRIGNLHFACSNWAGIQKFSAAVSGPLPLLQTLKINVVHERRWHGLGATTRPPHPLFADAVNLKQFHLCSEGSPFLDHFIFPNLTTLDLSAMPARGGFPTSQLLNFLEASPALRTVHIRIEQDVSLKDVPPGRVVVLPNVETFALSMGEDGPGCRIAAHISCPSVKVTTLLYEQDVGDSMLPEIFPTSVRWNAIARQYSASPVNEVVLGIITAQNPIIACFLTFLSPDPAALTLGFKVNAGYDDEEDDELEMTLGRRHAEIFSRASITIWTHPLLANVKRLSIQDNHIAIDSDELTQITSEVKQLFESMGPLDALTLDVSDLRPYLAPFLDVPEFLDMDQLDGFPPIKKLAVSQPPQAPAKQECMAAVVELAKSQHAAGVPFERVTIHMMDPPPEMADRLEQWVGAVHCCDEMCIEDDG